MGYMVDTYEEMLEQGSGDKQDTLNKASEVKSYTFEISTQ